MLLCKVMIITYFGKQFFKITQGDLTLAINPVSKHSKSGVSAHFGADIALVSLNHPDYNGADQLIHGDRKPFLISSPGDYEVRDILIKGLMSDVILNDKKYINTLYSFAVEGIKIVFLGALSINEISKEAREQIDSPDIVFVPVLTSKDKNDTLIDLKNSAKLASSLEPKLIIPMDYDETSLKLFLKELGAEGAERVEKLTLKRKDLEDKEADVVVLKAN